MRVIGITGGIGTGKSTATEYLRGKGLAYIDADQIGRDLTADGQAMLEIIRDKFGCVHEVVEDTKSGDTEEAGKKILRLDRQALAALIFNNEEKRKEYDSIIHAEIKAEIDRRIAECRSQKKHEALILDAPLLFEAGLENRCDFVILILADKEVRIKRVCARDGLEAEAVEARIRSQLSDEAKRAKADYLVDNSGSKEALYAQLDELLGD